MDEAGKVTVNVAIKGVDDATEKAEALRQKIIEAKTLAGELASMIGQLSVEVEL